MKKLMIIAAVAIVGFAASASTITWNNTSAVASVFNGGTAYLVFTSSSASAPAAWNATLNAAYIAAENTTYDIDSVLTALDSNSSLVGSTSIGATGTDKAGLFSGADAWGSPAGTNKKFYTIVISSDEKTMAIGTAFLKKTIQATDSHQVTTAFTGAQAASSTTWTTNVPEPTSGLLMLLGVAGLALRRRRA